MKRLTGGEVDLLVANKTGAPMLLGSSCVSTVFRTCWFARRINQACNTERSGRSPTENRVSAARPRDWRLRAVAGVNEESEQRPFKKSSSVSLTIKQTWRKEGILVHR